MITKLSISNIEANEPTDNHKLEQRTPYLETPTIRDTLAEDLYLSEDSNENSDLDFKTSLRNLKTDLDGLNEQLSAWGKK